MTLPYQDYPPDLRRLTPRTTKTGDPRSSLQGVNTFDLPDGALCIVQATGEDFQLFRESTDPPDGTTIIEPAAGPGRWKIRGQMGNGSTLGLREGLLTQWTSASTATFGPGRARSSNDLMDIVLAAPALVDITVAGAGGLDAGVEAADTWYALHVIGDSTGANPPDTLLSVSPTAPTLPAGYDSFRHVGWVRNDAASDFVKFRYHSRATALYDGDRTLGSIFNVLNSGSATAFTDVDCSDIVPPTSTACFLESALETDDDDEAALLRPDGSTEAFPVRSIKPGFATSVIDPPRFATLVMPLSDAQVLEYAVSVAGDDLFLYVSGYIDTL